MRSSSSKKEKAVGFRRKPEKEGTLGPVGSRELGNVVCSTGNLSQQQKLTKVNKRQPLSVLASTILGLCA